MNKKKKIMDNSERALKTVHENSSHAKRERKLKHCIIKLGKLATGLL